MTNMTGQLSKELLRLCNIYTSEDKMEKLSFKDKAQRSRLCREFAQYAGDNDITDVGQFPEKFDSIVNAELS